MQLTKKDFDDLVVEPNGSIWSQVCSDHAKKCGAACPTSETASLSICGVKGCKKEADYYVDFTPDYIGLNEAVYNEGWGVFHNVDEDILEIQRIDDLKIFDSDEDAIEHVVNQFLKYPKGSHYHTAVAGCFESDPKFQPMCGLDEMTLFYTQNRLDFFAEKVFDLVDGQEKPNGTKFWQGYGIPFLEFPIPDPNTKAHYDMDAFIHTSTPFYGECVASHNYWTYNFEVGGKRFQLNRHQMVEFKKFINSIPC